MISPARFTAYPTFPGLQGNACFRDIWRRFAAISVDPVVAVAKGACVMESVIFSWSQLDADAKRGEMRMGSSACAGIAVRIMEEALSMSPLFQSMVEDWRSEEVWRPIVADEVRAHDERCRADADDTEGSAADALIAKVFHAEVARGKITIDKSVAVDRASFELTVARAQSPCAFAITAPKSDSVFRAAERQKATGNTIVIASTGCTSTVGVDPHKRTGSGGMTVAHMPGVWATAAPAFTKWVYETVFPESGSKCFRITLSALWKPPLSNAVAGKKGTFMESSLFVFLGDLKDAAPRSSTLSCS